MLFFKKELSKAIMTRTRVQEIECVIHNKENFNEKSAVDNKLFWKNVKPVLSDKVLRKNEIYLIKNSKPIKTDLETLEVLNNFFSSVVQNLDISRYLNDEPYVNCVKDLSLKVVLK